MSKVTFKPGTMLNPVPAVLVSCGQGEQKNLITVGWTGVVNTEPPMVYISVRESRHSFKLIKESGEFVINLTTADMAKVTDFCGVKSGREVDKFKETGLTAITAQQVNCPMVEESPVNLECRVTEIKKLGTHHMFLARVVAVHADERLLNDKGKLCLDKAQLLAYSHGEYFSLGRKPLGTFGYSIMKPKTRKRRNRQAGENKKKKNLSR